ncbi:MAG: transposase, partial [Opitutales bacterium]|nr:transposase [Opitutales bacterium]
DLSAFVKIYKQQVSIWYNANHDRYGPLWSDRFKSVLVQGSGTALLVMAAYIDLNPGRGGFG